MARIFFGTLKNRLIKDTHYATINLRGFHKSLNVARETRSDARMASEGPRATVPGGFPSRKTATLPRRARACPSPCCGLLDVRGGQAPALRYREGLLVEKRPLPRRARACPSPCCSLPDVRGGQAPALRYREGFLVEKRPPSA